MKHLEERVTKKIESDMNHLEKNLTQKIEASFFWERFRIPMLYFHVLKFHRIFASTKTILIPHNSQSTLLPGR